MILILSLPGAFSELAVSTLDDSLSWLFISGTGMGFVFGSSTFAASWSIPSVAVSLLPGASVRIFNLHVRIRV